MRGVVLLLATILSIPGISSAEEHPAAIAVLETWEAARCGSPDTFLQTMDEVSASGMLDFCGDFLEILRARSGTELMFLFAAMRLEAAPGEVEHWDDRSVLEVLLSAPDHAYFFENSFLSIDSTLQCDSAATVWFSISDPYGYTHMLQLQVVNTPGGWRTAGLDRLISSIVEEHLGT